jgi:hypothetical protein
MARQAATDGKAYLQGQREHAPLARGFHRELADRCALAERALEIHQPLAQPEVAALGADLERGFLEAEHLAQRAGPDAGQRDAVLPGRAIQFRHHQRRHLVIGRRRPELSGEARRDLAQLRGQAGKLALLAGRGSK